MAKTSIKLKVKKNEFPKIARKLEPAAKEVVKETTNRIHDDWRGSIRHRTGKSQKSIDTAFEQGGLIGYVFSEWFVARLLETGTRKMAADPTLGPAAESERSGFVNAMRDIFDRITG